MNKRIFSILLAAITAVLVCVSGTARADGNYAFPIGTAGGDLASSYPNPSVSGLLLKPLPALTAGVLSYSGSAWQLGSLSLSSIPFGTAGQTLFTNAGATAATWGTFSGDFGCSTSTPGLCTLTQARGGVFSFSAGGSLTFSAASTAAILQLGPSTDIATTDVSLTAMSAFSGASVHTSGANVDVVPGAGSTSNGNPGSVFVKFSAPTGTGTEGGIGYTRTGSSSLRFFLGPYPGASYDAMWFGANAASRSTTNYAFLGDVAGTTTFINGSQLLYLNVGNTILQGIGANGVQFFDGGNFDIGGCVKCIGIGAVSTAPTTSLTAGDNLLYGDTAGVHFYGGGAGTYVTLGTTSTFQALKEQTRSVTSAYAVDSITPDHTVFVNTSSSVTVTLPAPTVAREICVKDMSGSGASVNPIVIAPHASELIDGTSGNMVVTTYRAWVCVISDGTNWGTE